MLVGKERRLLGSAGLPIDAAEKAREASVEEAGAGAVGDSAVLLLNGACNNEAVCTRIGNMQVG